MNRDTLASLRLVLGMALRADPWRAAIVLLPVQAVGLAVVEWSTKQVVDAGLAGDAARVRTWAAVIAVAAATWIGLALARFTLDMRLRERMGVLVDERLVRTVGSIPTTDHHDRADVADELELLRTNRGQLLSGVGALSNALSTVANLLVGAGLLLTVEPRAVLLPVAGLPMVWCARRAATVGQAALSSTAEAQREALHLFDLGTEAEAAEELRVFGLGGEVLDRHRDRWHQVEATRARADVRAAALLSGGSLCLTGGLVAVLWMVADRAGGGQVSPGDLVLVLSVLTHLAWQLRFLAMLGGWLVDIALTAGRLRAVEAVAAAAEADAPWRTDPVAPPTRLHAGIRLQGVGFTYPGAERASLRDVDLHLPAGSTVAIVGENGAGKTTLVQLLCGLRRPTEGRVLVDGVDLARIPPDAWRARLSAGFQDHHRFELLAGEAVALGDLGSLDDRDRARRSLDRAASLDVVDALPDGLDTALGRSLDGPDLSGGQWQKLALGRAVHRDGPLLLVLDEPTSALDAETEHRLLTGYATAATAGAERGAVTVLVSHRFSTVRAADLIVVVAGGTVVEVGDHATLHRAGGTYAELYELQAAAYR